MSTLLGLLFITIVTVVPVMFAAKMLNAGGSSFWRCFAGAILSGVAAHFVDGFVTHNILSYLVVLVITACIFMFFLKATFLQSAGIAVLAFIIQIAGLAALRSLTG